MKYALGESAKGKKMNFETKEIREANIALHDLKRMNEKFYFYYDESNNIRKHWLKDGTLNAGINTNFVLAGVVHHENDIDFDVYKLIDELKLQKNINEIKFDKIAHGNFIECLQSKKLNVFLNWLLESDLYIHYMVVNLFYFSIVDIVDSVMTDVPYDVQFVNDMKACLHLIASRESEYFINLLVENDYPNIKKEKISDFINKLITLIEKYEEDVKLHISLVSLKQLLKKNFKKQELVFIENNEDYILLNEFYGFYMEPIYMFINSEHKFDKESIVFERIKEIKLTYNNVQLSNYEELVSTENLLVQLSDVVAGLLAKFFDYITDIDIINLKMILSNLVGIQKENFIKFSKVINKSDKYNRAFLHSSISNIDREKLVLLEY